MKRLAASAAVVALVAGPVLPSGADELAIAAEAEAFALRVEYDLPVPVGSGTIPHVVGEIRKTNGENAKGLAAAPTNFDAVVGGTVYDPYKTVFGNDQGAPVPPWNRLPTTECFHPGQGADTQVRYPTDIRAETALVPPLSYASARCSPGPQTQLLAWAAGATTPGSPASAADAVVRTGTVSGEAVLRPVERRIESTARASAQAVWIAGGAVRIGSVEAEGASTVEGPGGAAATQARVALHNVAAAGQTFSVADDRILAGTASFPLGTAAAQNFMDTINASLQPSGCTITVLGTPSRYPQGYLLSRKPPDIGVAQDGTFAASMHGGMLVLCDLPSNPFSEGSGFYPNRLQVLVGFAYTMARATTEPSGFGIADLVAPIMQPPAPPAAAAAPAPDVLARAAAPEPEAADAEAAEPLAASVAAEPRLEARAVSVRVAPLDPGTRRALYAAGFLLLFLTTHLAARRLRDVLA